jgi:hypothetical protein
MMEELEINDQLRKEDLFELFRLQLKKDLESSSIAAGFVETLPSEYYALKEALSNSLSTVLKNSTQLSTLLYRVDVSEYQLREYQRKHAALTFEEIVVELMIKRTLQKIILKKKFSG